MKRIFAFAVALLLPVTAFAGCMSFTRVLKAGTSGDDVYALQKILNSDSRTLIAKTGDGAPGQETSVFGASVKDAVSRFQTLYFGNAASGTPAVQQGVVDAPTGEKLGHLSCEIDTQKPAPIDSGAGLGSGKCRPIPLASTSTSPMPKVVLENLIQVRVRRGDNMELYGRNFGDLNIVDFGTSSVCSIPSQDGGTRIEVRVPADAPLGWQYVRVTDKYGHSNLVKIFILPADTSGYGDGPGYGSMGCINITRTLRVGSSGEDVKLLQRFLNADVRTRISPDGPQSPGKETKVFDKTTVIGVKLFQRLFAADILKPAKLAAPNGVVGALMENKMRSLSGCPADINKKKLPVPTITSVMPASPSIGDDIVIKGTGFTDKNYVSLNGDEYGPYPSKGGGIVVTLKTSMATGRVSIVVRNDGGTSRPWTITIKKTPTPPGPTPGPIPSPTSTPPDPWPLPNPIPVPPVSKTPTIDSLLVAGQTQSFGATAKVGDAVTLVGKNYTATANQVKASGMTVGMSDLDSADGKTLVFTVPTSTPRGYYSLQVVNANGKSNSRSLYIDDGTCVGYCPTPDDGKIVIDSLTPQTQVQGKTIVIAGHGYESPTTIVVDEKDSGTGQYPSLTRITYTIPSDMATGTHDLYVKNAKRGKSNVVQFIVIDKNANAPRIDKIDPARAAVGTQVTITGANLKETNFVYLNGTFSTTAYGNSDGTSLQVSFTYSKPGDYTLHVENTGGKSNGLPFSLFVDKTPIITALNPTAVQPGGTFKVRGKYLDNAEIDVGGVAWSAVDTGYTSGVEMTVTVPADAKPGKYDVTAKTSEGTSAPYKSLTVNGPNLPIVSSALYESTKKNILIGGRYFGNTSNVSVSYVLKSGGATTTIPNQTPENDGTMLNVSATPAVGTYWLWVTNANGSSNQVTFFVTTSGDPVDPVDPSLKKPKITSTDPRKAALQDCICTPDGDPSKVGIKVTLYGTNFTTDSPNHIFIHGKEQNAEVSSDGSTLHTNIGGSAFIMGCFVPEAPTLNPFDLPKQQFPIMVKNKFGSSEAYVFEMDGPNRSTVEPWNVPSCLKSFF